MFTALSEQLTAVLKRLTGRGVLSEADVTEALREIRGHLLEADVGFEVTRAFVERVRERAAGALQVEAVRPGQQVGQQVGVPVFGTRDPGPGPRDVVELVQQAMRDAEQARCRTVIVDTAGRLQIDAVMMDELRALRGAVDPREVLLVADGMSGQGGVRMAQGFHAAVRLTGV